jgi:hypothetical protein
MTAAPNEIHHRIVDLRIPSAMVARGANRASGTCLRRVQVNGLCQILLLTRGSIAAGFIAGSSDEVVPNYGGRGHKPQAV